MLTPTAYWGIRFGGAVALLLACGAEAPSGLLRDLAGSGSFRAIDGILGVLAFVTAATSVAPLVRSLSVDQKLGSLWERAEHAAFVRASPEQQVFLLLLGIAEADGESGPRERELVRQFLLTRFASPQIRADIDKWSATARPPRNLGPLAEALAMRFGASECSTLYSWCCLVAFSDGALHQAEFRALQNVAQAFGLSPRYAQFLFDYAQMSSRKARGDQKAGANGNARQRASDNARSNGNGNNDRHARGVGTERERALETLGLPADASKEQIRQRHRELVRKFHPDAHQRLGPVAQQEAAERFKAIQRAYETLSA